LRLISRPRLAWILAASTAAVSAGLSLPVPTASASPSLTLVFTGSEQSFVVPAGVIRLQLRLVGAPGAGGESLGLGTAGLGGRGAVMTGTLPVTPLTTVYIEVGGPGQGSTGGFNGGGDGGHQGVRSQQGGGGGGSTDLRLCSATSCQGGAGASLASRLAIAGGGGGGGGAGDECFLPGDGGAGGAAGATPHPGADGGDGGAEARRRGRPTQSFGATGGAGGGAAIGAAAGSGGMSGSGQHSLSPGAAGGALVGGTGADGDESGSGGGGGAGWRGGGGGGGGGFVSTNTLQASAGGGGGGAGSSAAFSGSFTVSTDTTGVPLAQVAFLGPPPQVSGVDPGSGATTGGTAVTVAGSGFGGANGVSFGGTPVRTFQVLSDTSLTTVTPAHAPGTVDVTVTTAAGTSAQTAGDRFTFVDPSLPAAPETGSPASLSPRASPPTRGYC
jgi:IPT/TIG domain